MQDVNNVNMLSPSKVQEKGSESASVGMTSTSVFDMLAKNEAFRAASEPEVSSADSVSTQPLESVEATPADLPRQAKRFGCADCGHFDGSHGVFWCAGEPGYFRNVAKLRSCPKRSYAR